MPLHSGTRVPSGMKKVKYNAVCVENEESIISLLNEELSIDSDEQVDLETVDETASEELSNEMSESESESETRVSHVDGWEDMTNPRHAHLLQMQGHNLTFYQMQSPWTILVYFSLTSL
jgi:tRNA/tmRNA/rRNA uracil-C5-methylase (TrmA/RlmC/RlmD family)